MRRRLSLLLVMSLVLISIMTACFMGCTKAPKALKGVDVKDGDEVVDALKDIIKEGNYTAKAVLDTKDDGEVMTYYIQCNDERFYREEGTLGKKECLAVESKGKGVRVYTKDPTFGWLYTDDSTKYKDALKNVATNNMNEFFDMLYLEKMDYEYNKKDKVIEGTTKKDDVTYKATIEITEDEVTIEVKNSFAKTTITISEMGTTEPKEPSGAKPLESIL